MSKRVIEELPRFSVEQALRGQTCLTRGGHIAYVFLRVESTLVGKVYCHGWHSWSWRESGSYAYGECYDLVAMVP